MRHVREIICSQHGNAMVHRGIEEMANRGKASYA
jgi:hypothetical protein